MRRYKALIIGISYKKSKALSSSDGWEELDGPLRDAKRMKTFVKERLGYKHVVAITDKKDSRQVSRCNILEKLNWLVEGARDGDILFLHYAGHGGQRPTRRRTEEDDLDESIVPADTPYPAKQRSEDETIPDCRLHCSCAPGDPRCWKPTYLGMIRDNELRNILVEHLPIGVRLVTLFDTCHSGSILDLQYHYLPFGAVPPMLSSKGFTTIRPEQRQSARLQLRSHSELEERRGLSHQESSPCVLGETLATSVGTTLGHGMPVASSDPHFHAVRNKVQRDVTVSYGLREALSTSAGMAFGHSIPVATPQMTEYHMHAMRNESRRDVAVSCALTTGLETSAGVTFGHGISDTSLANYMHAVRSEAQRSVTASYALGKALVTSAGMAFGHGIPMASRQMVEHRADVIRNASQQDMAASCTLTTALSTSAGMPFGHGMPTASVRMVEDHMHAMRNELQRGVAVSLSACIDHDVVFELRGRRGMLTTFFIELLEEHGLEVHSDVLLDKMGLLFHSEWEKNWSDTLKHSPYPVLCSNQVLDLSSIFFV